MDISLQFPTVDEVRERLKAGHIRCTEEKLNAQWHAVRRWAEVSAARNPAFSRRTTRETFLWEIEQRLLPSPAKQPGNYRYVHAGPDCER